MAPGVIYSVWAHELTCHLLLGIFVAVSFFSIIDRYVTESFTACEFLTSCLTQRLSNFLSICQEEESHPGSCNYFSGWTKTNSFLIFWTNFKPENFTKIPKSERLFQIWRFVTSRTLDPDGTGESSSHFLTSGHGSGHKTVQTAEVHLPLCTE